MPRTTLEALDAARRAREADPTNPALIDAELEAERAHFERIGLTSRRRRLAVYLLLTLVCAAVAYGFARQQNELSDAVRQVEHLSHANRGLTTSLQSALVESCERNGNAAREVQRETLHEEISDAEHPDPGLVAALHIPPKTIERLTQERVDKLTGRLHAIRPVDCESQYHISPGSGDRRRDG